ncbi:TetR family transcriptional regulator [Sphingobium sp. AEW013]|nr:TetR family transcriptional regulator [Sphingobium sp. AEW013]
MDRIVARAGVSRGAQGHHFPTKSLLFQAAMTHMLDALIDDLRLQTERIRGRRTDPAAVFRHLWDEYFSGNLFAVTIELIVASRTDQELQEALTPVTERFHQQVDDCFYILNRGNDHTDRQLDSIVRLTMSLLRGMGVQTVLFDKPNYYREMLEDWFKIVTQLLEKDKI